MLSTKYISRVNSFLLKEALEVTRKHNEIRNHILHKDFTKEDLVGFLGDYGYSDLEVEEYIFKTT